MNKELTINIVLAVLTISLIVVVGVSLIPNKKVTADQVIKGEIPLCSSGKKVELDVDDLKRNHPEEYNKLPKLVKNFGFRPMICKED